MVFHTQSRRHAFTLVELIVIIVVLAILSGVAIPKYIDYATAAKEAAARGALGGIRSGIGHYYLNTMVNGSPTYPTLVQMQTLGEVMQESVPENPYNNLNTISAGVYATTPPVTGTTGYSYDAATGRIWLNSTTTGVDEHLW